VRHALHAGTDFVLALDDENPVWLQYPLGLDCRLDIELQHCVVPFPREGAWAIAIRVVVAERCMRAVPSK
jgi:hypothetical protein